jgi:CBS domain-containing protein
MSISLNQFLRLKPRNVISISPDVNVLEALKLMAKENIGAVMVLQGDNLVGILSERDYARKVVLEGKTSSSTKVSEIMTTKVITVEESQKVDDCMNIMNENHIRHLPVLSGGKVLGLISIGDVLKQVMQQQKDLIEQLEAYIRS